MKVVIVGGGISGLATAWRLQYPSGRRRVDVTVLEASPRPGGSAQSHRADGFLLETGPNGFLDGQPSTVALCRDLGLDDELQRAKASASRRFVSLNDELHELPASPGRFLRSNLLSLRGRLRVLWERFTPPQVKLDESVRDFGCRRIGREATDVLLDALVTGIHAGDYSLLSLPACFPRIAALERQYGGLIKGQIALAKLRRQADPNATPAGSAAGPAGTLTAPRSGMGRLTEALAQRLGESLLLGRPAAAIEPTPGGGWRVVAQAGDTLESDAVVLACPAYAQAKILSGVDENLARLVGEIPYTTAVVCVVGFHDADLPRRLDGFGYITPERFGRPVLGVQWCSSFFDGQAPAGCAQLRAILGGWRRRDVLEWSDQAVVDAVCSDLARNIGLMRPPMFHWIHRWERALPQYHVGHLKRIEAIDDVLRSRRGLYLAGNAYRGVAINDCTREAERIAGRILQDFDS